AKWAKISIFHMRFDIWHCPKVDQCLLGIESRPPLAMSNIKSHMENGKWFSSSRSLWYPTSVPTPGFSQTLMRSENHVGANVCGVLAETPRGEGNHADLRKTAAED